MNVSNERENELGTAPVRGLLFKLAVPAITAQIVNVLYNVVDRIYIGHIPVTGELSLTGVGVWMPLIMLISAFTALAAMGGAPRASIMMGRGDKEAAQHILGNCATLLFLISIVLTIVFQVFAEPFLMRFGASEDTIGFALQYMRIYALGTIFVQTTIGLDAFISAQGFAKISMCTILIGAVINIILDPIFIFVLGMGVRGAALATVIAQACSAAWVLHFLTGKKTILHLGKKYMGLHAKIIMPCVLLGLSPFVMQATEAVLILCFNSSLLKYGGNTAVGAMTILGSAMQFSMLPLQGLSQGAQPITGYNFGARKPDRVRQSFKNLLLFSMIYVTVLWLIMMLFPRQVAMLFADSEEFLDYTAWALRIYMMLSFVMGAQIACQQTFIAIGNAKTSLFLAIYRKIILLIPLIYILPHFMVNKAKAVFMAEPAADLIAVTTTVLMFIYQFRHAMAKLEDKKTAESV